MQKLMQKFTSAFLAANMIFSIVATNFVAYAEETPNALSVSEEVLADDAVTPGDAAVISDDENIQESGDSSETATPTETPSEDKTVTSEPDSAESGEKEGTDTAEPAPGDETTEKEGTTSENPDSEETVEPTESPAPTETPDADKTSESTGTPEPEAEKFVGLRVVTPEYGDNLTADFGNTVTLDALLNRDDVNVTYQWQVKRNYTAEAALAVYDYVDDEPTWYSFIISDKTEAEVLEENPDYTWQGCEMYYAVVDALDEIGADSANVQIAWHTPNYYLDGYEITAGTTDDGVTEIYATKENETYTAHLNDNGQWEFSEEATAALPTEWQNIEGATEASYSFEFTEDEMYNTYQCIVTVVDDKYREENFAAIEELGTELTEEDKTKDITLLTVQFKVQPTDESAEQLAEERLPASYAMLASTFSGRNGAGTPSLSSDNQWITGLNGSYEYLTKAVYDKVTQWLNEGSINQTQANRYWTQLGGSFSTKHFTANVLDDNGFPTGATREYMGFDLTDGHKLEVNSEWYGQTVYFRPHNDASAWSVTGTAIDIPAYTSVIRDADKGNYGTGASGTKYKDSIVFLNPWVSDAGRVYVNYLKSVSNDGWLRNTDGSLTGQHITVLSIKVETFNADPARYMVDAEGNFRIDSIGYGVCVGQEPDLSGKAYYVIKDFLSKGYGMCIGHDTMYAYAGAWYDAHISGYITQDSRDYYEGNPAGYGPDPNDTSTRYYQLNSAPNFDNGHWNMNALMGSNGGNIDSGTILPTDANSMILSTGGSHSKYGKAGIMYGSSQLGVCLRPYSHAQAINTIKYRTPTNYPFELPDTFESDPTHTNSQVAFGPVWVDYRGGNTVGAPYGYNNYPTTKTITDAKTGRTWFGTSNFYLSGAGNFLMNQIGHLPNNKATAGESQLFANTVMYISQRKQCEICAANQNGQEDVRFVTRVTSVNYMQVLTALQNGGNFWYPLNGCYQVVDDLTLPEGWEPIKNFSGHWNSDAYHVNLASNGKPLFDNTQKQGVSGWNLGTDKAKGVVAVFKNTTPAVVTTGVARVLGDMNALFAEENTDYTGYVVKILGSDNSAYMSSGEVYSCVVNSDGKYVISNLPCVFNKATKDGKLLAHVYTPNGTEVTQYGVIRVNVAKEYWDNCETTPLYLSSFTVDPVENEETYESAQGFFTATTTCAENVNFDGWQYRENESAAWKSVPSSMATITTESRKTSEGDYFLKAYLTMNNTNPNWDGYQFRALFSSARNGQWNTYEYYQRGAQARNDAADGWVRKQVYDNRGNGGKLSVKLWPTFAQQSKDQSVYASENATFTATGYAMDDGTTVRAKWQYSTEGFDRYNGGRYLIWHDISADDTFGHEESTSSSVSLNYPDAFQQELASVNPQADWNAFKNTSQIHQINTSLTVKRVDYAHTGTHFRAVFTATTSHGTTYEWASNIADETNGKFNTDTGNFGNFSVSGKKGNSNIISVKTPVLQVVTTKSADCDGRYNPDTLTPDDYGQMVVITNPGGSVANTVTAVYEAVAYYKATTDMLKPSLQWQYMTLTDKKPIFFADTNSKCSTAANLGLSVSVKNTDLGTVSSGRYAGYHAIRSTITIGNVPLSMYNPDTQLKYYFRLSAAQNYSTVKASYNNVEADKWGGLVVDYSISVQHNGVLSYDNTNRINGYTVTDAAGITNATNGRNVSEWYYPKLKIKVPGNRYINSVIVSFEGSHNSSDKINYNSGALSSLGINVEQASATQLVLTSKTKNGVSTGIWENALQNYVSFTTYDKANFSAANVANNSTGGAKIKWYVDEHNFSGLKIDTSGGSPKAFKVVDAGRDITWEEAQTLASTSNYSSELGVSGKLAELTTDSQRSLAHEILGNNVAYVNGRNTTGTWMWQNSNTRVNTSVSGSGSYLTMNGSGALNGVTGRRTVTVTKYVPNLGRPAGWSDGQIGAQFVLDGVTYTRTHWMNAHKLNSPVSGSTDGNWGNSWGVPNKMDSDPLWFRFGFWAQTGHVYYVKFAAGGYGDAISTARVRQWFMSENNWRVGNLSGCGLSRTNLSGYDELWTATATGEMTFDVYTDTVGPYCYLYSLSAFDLTEAFGAGNESANQWRVRNNCGWNYDIWYNNVSYTDTTETTDNIHKYIVEYNLDSFAIRANNHAATDSTYIGTNVKTPTPTGEKTIQIALADNEKVYDGTQLAPSEFVVMGTNGVSKSLVQLKITACVPNNQAGYTEKRISGDNWTNTEAVNATMYLVEASLTSDAYNNGWRIGSGSKTKCYLTINPRPINLYSYHNDKMYDGKSDGMIRNISMESATGSTGVVNGDEVSLTTTTLKGYYVAANGKKAIHASAGANGGQEYTMLKDKNESIEIVHNSTSDPHCNYCIGTETYTGPITSRPLYLHSLYKEEPDKLRNVKTYDGSTTAVIRDILMDNVVSGDDVSLSKDTLSGNYATKDAGEQLDADGNAKPNRLANLTEVTIAQSETPVLTNNPYGDYYIASQRYSGAIARASLTAQVKNWRGLYGDGVGEKPWHDTKAYGYGVIATDGCWLNIDGVAKGDNLTLDAAKSHFETLVDGHADLVPDATTAVGMYPLTYVGLTEQNYPILKNYIVSVFNGRFEVEPRPIRITVVDDDKLVYQQNPNFHVKIQLENADGSLTDVTSDVDANPILNAALKGNDKICDTLFVLKDGVEEAITQDFETNYDGWKKDEVPESKTNIPFTTDCNEESLPRYANGTPGDNFDWVEEAATCGFCDCKHKDLAPYQVLINTDPEAGAALVVRKVTNLNGEQVSNYTLDIVEGRLFVHPALLKVTVPLYVCMYGYNSSGEVVEPTNYRVVNYSTVPIRIKNINVHGNWTVKDVPGIESYDKGDYSSSYYQPTNNTLKPGELYMRMRNTVLHEGDNPIESSNTAWVIPRATGNFVTGDITGVGMRIPMAVYTASGNVNEANECTPVTKVTYTVLPYGGKMQDASQYESVPNPFYDPNAGGTGSGS